VALAAAAVIVAQWPSSHAGDCNGFSSACAPVCLAGDTPAASAGPDGRPAPGSEDSVYCRPAQPRADSRLPGPKICKTIREWNALHAAGYDVDANGVVKPLQGMQDLNNLSH